MPVTPVASSPGLAALLSAPAAPLAPTAANAGPADTYSAKKANALIHTARDIAAGQQPYAAGGPPVDAAAAQLAALVATPAPKKSGRAKVLLRSAALTSLLSIARTKAAAPATRALALKAYVEAMASEPLLPLRMSLASNLVSTKLAIPAALAPAVDQVRAELLKKSLPYDQWFKGSSPKLTVKHYVMDDFWKDSLAAYQARGFTVTPLSGKRAVATKTLVDPSGERPPVATTVTLIKDHQNVLRDMDDPSTEMIIYSGHSQLGGVVEASLASAPKAMAGTKALLLFNCRGKQTAPDVLQRFPGVHLAGTALSAYDDDDNKALSALYDMIARRGTYADARKSLRGKELTAGLKNYVLPDDLRTLLYRDDDADAQPNHSALGADLFFDPGVAPAGNRRDFLPRKNDADPDTLSAQKVSTAIGFANTSLFYFAEANHAAPAPAKATDRLIPVGWHHSPNDALLKITEVSQEDGTWYQVSMNSRYAAQGTDSLTMMAVMEVGQYLAKKFTGKYTAADKLRTAMQVGEYVSLYAPYLEDCQALMKGFGKKYGYAGLTWEAYLAASAKDGEHGLGSAAALAVLKKEGVRASAVGR